MVRTRIFAALGLLTLALAAPAGAADGRATNSGAGTTESVQMAASVPRGATLGSRAEEQRYAAREAASPEAKKYRAGDVIVISVTTAALIVLVVVLLIIIL